MPFWSGVSEVRSGVFSAVFAGLGAGVVTLLVLKNFLKDMKLGELLRVQGNILKALEECRDQLKTNTTAAINMERRMMENDLSGAEASRLIAAEVHDYQPYGPVATWHPNHSFRCLEEIRANWRRSLEKRGLDPTEAMWDAVVGGGYSRAEDEQAAEEPAATNLQGQQITLQDKIQYWRAHVPGAAGLRTAAGGVPNLLIIQRQLQLGPHTAAGTQAPEVLRGDLCGWRAGDISDWMARFPGVSPTAR